MESAAPALDPSFSFASDVAVRRPPATVTSFEIPGVRPASALEIRPAPDMFAFGIASLDALTGGVPRGALTEMVGPASSGRTSVMLALMAEVTRRQEVCALVDVTDSFDPASAEAAGIDLRRVLWVRCGKSRSQQTSQRSLVATGVAGSAAAVPRCTAPESNAERVQQAITSGCFESARGRRASVTNSTPTMNSVAPPAKNISWSIHENYDSRLRHTMVNGKSRSSWPLDRSYFPDGNTNMRKAEVRPRQFAATQKAKWDRLDQALKATDLLIQSGGFGSVIVDLGDIPPEQARRIPLTSWFRFRRAVENTPTILLVVAKDSCAKTCASLVMQLSANPKKSGQQTVDSGQKKLKEFRDQSSTVHCPLAHVSLLEGLNVHVELLRTRLGEPKPVRSAVADLETRTQWKKTG
jgi:hypothetical protein